MTKQSNRQSGQSTARLTTRYYWSHASKHPLLITGTLLTLPAVVLTGRFLPPLIIANIFNRLTAGDYAQGEVWQGFGRDIILAALAYFGSGMLWRVVDFFAWRLEARVQKSLAEDVYAHLMSLSADFHANSFGGSLVSRTNKLLGSYVRISDTTIFQVIPMLWGVIFMSVILLPRAPIFVGAFLLITIAYIAGTTKITKPTRRAAAEHANAETRQTGYLADSITNVLAIKSFAGSSYERRRFAKATKNTHNKLMNLMRKTQIQISYFTLVDRVLQFTAVIFAIISIVVFNSDVGTIFLIVSYSGQLSGELFNFGQNSLRSYNRALADAKEMTEILQLSPEIKDPEHPEVPKIIRGQIRFKNVSFAHNGSHDSIFRNLNLNIKPGEKIGLVGHSGSGKTTLTKLVMRFVDIDSGAIELDGQDIRNITQDALHERIAYVPQEPIMFHRSLSENIQYGDFNADQRTIEAIAKQAHAHDFIQALPEGYDTLVGERGVKLSGGQRQRVAIARAMLKNAPILLLDEATSALDSESEALIQDALWKLMEGRTAIVIAHRLSTIQKMDRILVMDNGKIVEEGSHKELLRQDGIYASLWNRQSGGFLEQESDNSDSNNDDR